MPSCEEFSLKYRSVALYDFKGLQPGSISVSFCDLSVELYTRDLVKFLRRRLFQHRFFKMAGSGLALALEDVRLFTVLFSRSKDFACLFTATELRSSVASFDCYREPGNMYLLEMTMNLLLCGFRLFMLYWTRYHTDLEQMLKKKIFVKMDTECWKLLLK